MTALPAAASFATGRHVGARLTFRAHRGRTHLAGQFTPHPFHITRPFYAEGDPDGMATLYLQSSAGGLYAGDDLSLALTVEDGAAAHVTTQASTVAPGVRGGAARQAVALDVGAGALAEYVADPLILFHGARVTTSIAVEIAAGGRAIVADGLVLHRPGGGAVEAALESTVSVAWREGVAASVVDRQQASGAELSAALTPPRSAAPWTLATLYLIGGPDGAAAALRGALADHGPDATVGVSDLARARVVVVRIAAAGGDRLSALQAEAWCAARRLLVPGHHPPRRRK